MKLFWWGLQDYLAVESLQHKTCLEVSLSDEDIILAGEHPLVITKGRRTDPEDVRSPQDIPVIQASRGGRATIHGPGQLVIYPILNLRKRNWGVRDYVGGLLETTVQTLRSLGIPSESRLEGNSGVFTSTGKIAFCGLQVRQGISLHGISINVSNDLNQFSNLVSCGVQGQSLDSLELNGINLLPEEFFNLWMKNYSSLLEPKFLSSQRGAVHRTDSLFCERTLDLNQE